MPSHVEYQGVARSHDDDSNSSNLFDGQKLFFSHAVPQRRWLLENARKKGAVIVDRETDADVILVDHARKNNAPGTYSYQYVESSIRRDSLENLAAHAVGAATRLSRPVGSTVTAPKSGRTPYTPADDQFLWDWVKPYAAKGGTWKGNEIYKQLEAANPRHTYQSWRDRWIKHTQYQNLQVTENAHPPRDETDVPEAMPSRPVVQRKRPRPVADEGEELRASSSGRERATDSVQPRRSPVRRLPQRRPNTMEDDREGRSTDPATQPNRLDSRAGTRVAEEEGERPETKAITRPAAEPESGGERIGDDNKERENHERESRHRSETSSGQDLECAICVTSNTSKWRQDRKGRILCNECIKLVKAHGFQRASIIVNREDAEEQLRVTADVGEWQAERFSRAVTERNHLTVAALPDVSAAAKSLQDIADPSHNVTQHSPGRSRRTDSPSFQPQSPSIGGPPASNISKKRSTGRSSQSTSTQPSNSNSQNTTSSAQSQGQGVNSQVATAEMGQAESTEKATQPGQAPLSSVKRVAPTAPSFRPPLNAKEKRLQDEPDTLHSPQDSSLSSNAVPPSQRSARLSSSNSNRAEGQDPPSTLLPTLTTVSGEFQMQARAESPLFLPEDGDEWGPVVDDTHRHPAADGERASVSTQVQLVSEGHEINMDSRSTSEAEDEEMDEDVDVNFGDLVSPSKRQRSEESETAQETPGNYETAQEEQTEDVHETTGGTAALFAQLSEDDDLDMTEIPDPPGGFEPYGVPASLVPPDQKADEDLHEGPVALSARNTEFEAEEGRDESPQIKVEYGSSLGSQQQPILLAESPLHDASSATGPDGLLGAKIEGVQNQDDRQAKRAKISEGAQKREDQEPQEGDEQQTIQETGLEAERRAPIPSSTTRADQISSEPPTTDPEESSLTINEWLDQQRHLRPTTPVLEPILFKALESTSMNLRLAADLVELMISNRDAHLTTLQQHNGGHRFRKKDIASIEPEELLPQDRRGVWTKQDDEDLKGDEEKQVRMATKHGRKRCLQRFDFVREMED